MEQLPICECGAEYSPPTHSTESAKLHCFKCKMKSFRVNWVGGGSYGRQAFHDKTTNEVVREQWNDIKKAGNEKTMEPAPVRQVLI